MLNLSLSDSNISNRGKLILKEAKNAWEVGKKITFSIQGEERIVIEDFMRLEA